MMEKVKEFLKKVPDWVKAVVVSMVIVAAAVGISNVVNRAVHRNCIIVEDDFSCVFQIDSVEVKNESLELAGWVFELDKDASEDDFEILLYDYNNDKKYYLKMNDVVREDVNNYFLCEYDYTNSGFEANIKTKRLDLDNTNYEVLIQETNSRNAIATGIYISKGELMYVKPEEYVPLDVVGTELEEIMQDDSTCYFAQEGLYIYIYDNSIYYIATPEFTFSESGFTEIPLHIYAIDAKKLPEKSQQYGFENRDIIFERYELKGQFGNCRVAVRELPADYAMAYIRTGFYSITNQKWIWMKIKMIGKW